MGFTAIVEKRPQYKNGLDFKYNKEKWEFIAKEQSEGQWMKN